MHQNNESACGGVSVLMHGCSGMGRHSGTTTDCVSILSFGVIDLLFIVNIYGFSKDMIVVMDSHEVAYGVAYIGKNSLR